MWQLVEHASAHENLRLSCSWFVLYIPDIRMSRYNSYSLVVEGKKHPNPEKNGRELNLVSIDAEFPIDRHIQNPLKSSIGKNFDIF